MTRSLESPKMWVPFRQSNARPHNFGYAHDNRPGPAYATRRMLETALQLVQSGKKQKHTARVKASGRRRVRSPRSAPLRSHFVAFFPLPLRRHQEPDILLSLSILIFSDDTEAKENLDRVSDSFCPIWLLGFSPPLSRLLLKIDGTHFRLCLN